jgi:hypothetical protein
VPPTALQASPENPIRGVTSDTLANIPLRVPVPGIAADSLREAETEGSSWYNGLEVSLTKRFSYGLQILASYTFSKTLDTDGADINGTSAANTLTLGDQNSPAQRWGRASFDRTQRFVFSATWTLPTPSSGCRELSWETGPCRQSQPFNLAAPSPSPTRIPRMSMGLAKIVQN